MLNIIKVLPFLVLAAEEPRLEVPVAISSEPTQETTVASTTHLLLTILMSAEFLGTMSIALPS